MDGLVVTMTKHEHCCPACTESLEALRMRNENTKVWIQADTQTREYACSLERELKWKDPLVEKVLPKHAENPFWATKDNGATWEKVPCTGKDRVEAYETMMSYLSQYPVVMSPTHMGDYIKRKEAHTDIASLNIIKAYLQEVQYLIACATPSEAYLATVRLHAMIDQAMNRKGEKDVRETYKKAFVGTGTHRNGL